MTRKEHLLKLIPDIEYDLPLSKLNLILEAMENHTTEQLQLAAVVGRSGQLFCPHCKSGEENFTRNGHHIWCRKCDYEFNVG